MSKKILLNSIDAVKKFVNIVCTFSGEVDLISGRYTIDAKSIMGIFSLDLTKPIEVVIHDESQSDKFFKEIEQFLI